MVLQVVILAGHTDAHVHARTGDVEARLLQKSGIFGGHDEIVGPRADRQRDAGTHFGDVGVDVHHPLPAGDADTVVAVEHEVAIADLVDLYRRQVTDDRRGRTHRHPALFVHLAARQEGAREVLVAADTADDGRHRNLSQPARRLAADTQLVGDFLIGQQLGRLSRQPGQQALDSCLAACPMELLGDQGAPVVTSRTHDGQ